MARNSLLYMVITFYGEGCFKLQSGEVVILTDPFDNKTGLVPPRLKPDIIIKTLTPLPITHQPLLDTQYLIYGPGEYNIKNINITGFSSSKESTEKFLKNIYLMEVEEIKCCFLGHLSEILEPAILEHLENIDILFIPAGGSPFLDQKSAVKIVKQLQPKIVIPSFFKIPSLKRQSGDLKTFLAEFNGPKEKQIIEQEKITIKKKDLVNIKNTEIAVLKI